MEEQQQIQDEHIELPIEPTKPIKKHITKKQDTQFDQINVLVEQLRLTQLEYSKKIDFLYDTKNNTINQKKQQKDTKQLIEEVIQSRQIREPQVSSKVPVQINAYDQFFATKNKK